MRRLLPVGLTALLLLVTASTALGHPESAPYNHVGTHRVGLPDLKADPADGLRIEATSSTTLNQLLLRFNGYIYNSRTAGTLEIHGSQRTDNTMGTVQQRVYDGIGSTWQDIPLTQATVAYENGDGHKHWHLNAAARYSLVAAGSGALVAPSSKVGFCAIDSEGDHAAWINRGSYIAPQWHWQDTATSSGHGNCGDYQPLAAQAVMGLTPGWRDKYGANLYNQWVDISNVLPGTYLVRNQVDPMNYVIERDEINPPADTPVSIPGYLAGPVSVSGTTSATIDVPLDVDYVTSPLDTTREAPKIRIANAPDHGTLNVPTGQWVAVSSAAPTVRYTPAAGSVPGADSFTYEVREGDSPYPRTPSRAGVAITTTGTSVPVPAEEVVISGGGGTLVAGTTRQLSAQVVNPGGTGTIVEWAAQGVAGGNATVGTISATGLYTAPGVVPADDTVDITARSDRGVIGRTTITIAPPPLPTPIPTPNPIDPTSTIPITIESASTMTLSAVKATRESRTAIIGMLPGQNGRVTTTLYNGTTRKGACTATVTTGVRYTCRISFKKPSSNLRVRILATRF